MNRALKGKRSKRLTRDWYKEIPQDFPTESEEVVFTPSHSYPYLNKHKYTYPTGSTYEGFCDGVGFSGAGKYTFPSGAVYIGSFSNGEFHGLGVITYPNGQQLEGQWVHGRLKKSIYIGADGLAQDMSKRSTYCQFPDRRFAAEIREGLRPAGDEQLTNLLPTKPLQPHWYDTVDGYYDIKAKIVYKDDGEILRVVGFEEERFIERNYRSGTDKPIGHNPDLYEFWTVGKNSDREKIQKTRSDISSEKSETNVPSAIMTFDETPNTSESNMSSINLFMSCQPSLRPDASTAFLYKHRLV